MKFVEDYRIFGTDFFQFEGVDYIQESAKAVQLLQQGGGSNEIRVLLALFENRLAKEDRIFYSDL